MLTRTRAVLTAAALAAGLSVTAATAASASVRPLVSLSAGNILTPSAADCT